MALNFPANPNTNDTYTSGGVTWEFDGTAWNIVPVQRNIFTNISADSGSTTPNITDDTLTISGGDSISTSISGDTLTVNFTGQAGGASNAITTVVTDDGTFTATGEATLQILGRTNISTELTTDTNELHIDLDAFSIDFLSDVDTTSSAPVTGNVLKWNGTNWAPGTDATTGGAGTDADTLDGFDSSYFLDYNNLSNTPDVVALTSFSVGNELTASGNGAISYDDTTGVFRYTPPTAAGLGALTAEVNDLSSAVTWVNVPDANITQSSVTQHQAALSITESQISDLGNYITGISASDLNTISIDALSDVDTTTSAPTNGQILAWNDTSSAWVPSAAGAGGDVNQNAFSTVTVLGSSDIVADSTTDTLNLVQGNGIVLSTDPATDTITITSNINPGASQFSQLSDIQSAGLTVDRIYKQAIVRLTAGAVGFTAYTFNSHYSGNNPTLYAISGTTFAIDLNGAPGHPTEIQNSSGTALGAEVYHVDPAGTVRDQTDPLFDADRGTIYWDIPETTSGTFRYQCIAHPAMVGTIIVKRLSTL
jgi:hypothetical protein